MSSSRGGVRKQVPLYTDVRYFNLTLIPVTDGVPNASPAGGLVSPPAFQTPYPRGTNISIDAYPTECFQFTG